MSGALDGEIWVWSVDKPGTRVCVEGGAAHKEGVNGVVWMKSSTSEGKGTVRSVGGDAAVKEWVVEGVE